MMSNLRQAAQRALKAMEDGEYRADMIEFSDALIALRAALAEPDYWQEEARRYAGNADYWRKRYKALAEPEQEPVAWANMKDGEPVLLSISQHPEDRANWMNPVPLYTAPTPRKQDDDEVKQLRALNAELVEALNALLNDVGRANSMLGAVKARAVLAKAEASNG